MYGDAYQWIAIYLYTQQPSECPCVFYGETKYYPGRSMFKTIVTFGAAF